MKRSRLPYLLQKATNRPLGAMHGIKAIAFQPVRWLAGLLPYGHNQVTREQWNQEYAGGRWDYLHQVEQLARYSVITGYYQQLKPGGSVLDLGCGDGILLTKLQPFGYSRYVGVDLSPEAISRALAHQADRSAFVVANIEEYQPEERFDVIIFNECLYYFDNPPEIVKRYEPFLEEGGVLIISLYVTEMNKHIWKMLERIYDIRDGVRITHHSGNGWTIRVFQPSAQKTGTGLEERSRMNPSGAEIGNNEQIT